METYKKQNVEWKRLNASSKTENKARMFTLTAPIQHKARNLSLGRGFRLDIKSRTINTPYVLHCE